MSGGYIFTNRNLIAVNKDNYGKESATITSRVIKKVNQALTQTCTLTYVKTENFAAAPIGSCMVD